MGRMGSITQEQAKKVLENIALIRAGRKRGFKVSEETLAQLEKQAQGIVSRRESNEFGQQGH